MTPLDELLDVCQDMVCVLEWWQHTRQQSDYAAVVLALRQIAPRFIEAVKAMGEYKPIPPDTPMLVTYRGREISTTAAGLKAVLEGLKNEDAVI